MVFDTIVTKEDYLQETGVDLNTELQGAITNDIGDDPAPRFIAGIEKWLWEHYSTAPFVYWDVTAMSEWQEAHFERAVIYQIQYVLKNGSILNDSGYNQSNGQIVPREVLQRIGISEMTEKMMKSGGMANLKRF